MKIIKQLLKDRNGIGALIAVALFGAGYFLIIHQKGGGEKNNENPGQGQSIAVLPFVNMGNQPGQEYFSDGLTDGILNALAHLKGLKVSARSSSFQFRGAGANIKEAANKLNVRSILEGSYQLSGDRIHINARLFNAGDASPFWSANYDENLDDMFAFQDKIANAVAEKLDIGLLQREITGAKKPITNKEAYDLYLKGRLYWNLRTAPDLKKGIDLFKQAIAIDSSLAVAYSGIADCYTALGYGSFLSPADAFPKALEAATKALQLDSALPEPHASLAFYKFYYEWDWAAAEQEFRITIALNPNYEIGYDWYGYYLTAMKRYDEAIIILKKAAELDPLSVPIATDIGFSFYYSGNYDLAIKKLQASLQMNPKFTLAHIWMGRCYQQKKIYPEAIAAYKKALEVAVDWPVALAAIGNVYGVSGQQEAAQKTLDTMMSLSSKKYVTSYGIALVQAGLGKTDLAFAWLNKAFEERSHWLVWLKTDPRWTVIRSDKRFTELINKVGLPD